MFKLKNKYYRWLALITIFLLSCLAAIAISVYRLFTPPVLAFHNIFPDRVPQTASLDYSLKDLKTLLTYLLENNYWFLDTQEMYDYFLIKSKPIPNEYAQKKPILLTFDDGHKNIDLYVLPLLKQLESQYNQKIKIVLWVNPKNIANQNQKAKYLNCSDLQKGMERGFYDIQSHGFSHLDLTQLSTSKLNAELKNSQIFLQQCLQEIPKNETVAQHFAYPYDRSNSQVETYTAKYYLSAYKFSSRLRNIRFKSNNYTIPRIGVNSQDTVQNLIRLID